MVMLEGRICVEIQILNQMKYWVQRYNVLL